MASERTREHRGSFIARKSDGSEVVIEVYGDVIKSRHLGGGQSVSKGLNELECDLGPVNRLERGTYEIVQTGEVLTSDDPAAV